MKDWPYDYLIATGCYSNVPNHYIGAISISCWFPKWYGNPIVMRNLAPHGFKNDPIPEYIPKFKKLLSKLDPHEVATEAKAKVYKRATARGLSDQEASQITPILLCWETPEKFCHRHMVSEWLNNEMGMYVPEVKVRLGKLNIIERKKKPKEGPDQLSLL
jgi:hypothetical protein